MDYEKGDIILIGGHDDLSDTNYLAENLKNGKRIIKIIFIICVHKLRLMSQFS